jgi:hypothetical protein
MVLASCSPSHFVRARRACFGIVMFCQTLRRRWTPCAELALVCLGAGGARLPAAYIGYAGRFAYSAQRNSRHLLSAIGVFQLTARLTALRPLAQSHEGRRRVSKGIKAIIPRFVAVAPAPRFVPSGDEEHFADVPSILDEMMRPRRIIKLEARRYLRSDDTSCRKLQ